MKSDAIIKMINWNLISTITTKAIEKKNVLPTQYVD